MQNERNKPAEFFGGIGKGRRSCGSEKLNQYGAEIALQFPGLRNIDKPAIYVFAKVFICTECGTAQFSFPEAELRLLKEGNSSATGGS